MADEVTESEAATWADVNKGSMDLKLIQTSFTVSDLDRSIAFYRDVLGMPLVAQNQQVG